MSSGAITSTTNTFGMIPGTLTGSVGVPGPAGPAGVGVPAGGTAGQFLQKTTTGVDYATDWVTVNLTGLATESWVTAGFYPLTGNQSGFLTASALTPYLTSATAASTYQTLAGMSDYLAKAGNLAGLANTGTARTNLGLGSLAVINDAPSDGSQYARKNGAWDVVSAGADFISSVSSPLAVTTGNLTIDLSAYAQLSGATFTGNVFAPTPSPGTDSTRIATTEWVKDLDYAPLNSPQFNGNPRGPTPSLSDNDTSLATTAFVKGQGYLTSAPVTSVAGRTGAITLTTSDVSGLGTMATQTATDYLTKAGNLSGISSTSTARTNLGLGSLATVNDAPADGSQYARKNNAWEVVTGGGGGGVAWGSITGTLADQTDLGTELGGKANLSGATFTGAVNAPTPSSVADDTQVINRAFSERFLGFNWADLIATKISNITFSLTGSSLESPYEADQYVYFDFCCPEAINNIKSMNSSEFIVYLTFYQGSDSFSSWDITASTISSTSNTRSFYGSLEYGQSYDVKVVVYLGPSSSYNQVSRFKVSSVSV